MENSQKRKRVSEGQVKLFKRYKRDVFPHGVDQMVKQELAFYKVLLSDIYDPRYSHIRDGEEYNYRRGDIFVNLLTGTGYVTTKYKEDVYLVSMSSTKGDYPLLLEKAQQLFPDSIYLLYSVRQNLREDQLGKIVPYEDNETGVIVSNQVVKRYLYLFNSKKFVLDEDPVWEL